MATKEEKINSPSSEEEHIQKEQAEHISGNIFTRGATKEQLRELRTAAAAHKAAQTQLTEAFGVLWNSHADMAMATARDLGEFRSLLSDRLNLWDDCSCGGAGPCCW